MYEKLRIKNTQAFFWQVTAPKMIKLLFKGSEEQKVLALITLKFMRQVVKANAITVFDPLQHFGEGFSDRTGEYKSIYENRCSKMKASVGAIQTLMAVLGITKKELNLKASIRNTRVTAYADSRPERKAATTRKVVLRQCMQARSGASQGTLALVNRL